MMQKTKLSTLLSTLRREPLFHFLLIGVGLFALFNQVGSSDIEMDKQIIITQVDLDRLSSGWLRRMGRPPSEQERELQLDQYIREQVLYREAMVMGLDQKDTIIRRRLAQKMEYLFDDLSFIPEPTEEELSTFLSGNASKFTVPPSITFSHIYLSSERRGKNIESDAAQLLRELNSSEGGVDITTKGDRSLLPYDFSEEREASLARIMGASFAEQVFKLPEASWQGPINSKYGVHLVYVKSLKRAQLPPLADVRNRVSSEWLMAKQNAANLTFYQSVRQRYEVVIKDVVIKKENNTSENLL